MFLQTLAMNSRFKSRLASVADLRLGSMRMIDWKRGKPYIYRISDFEELVSSPCLFARKFDCSIDSEIVKSIYNFLHTQT